MRRQERSEVPQSRGEMPNERVREETRIERREVEARRSERKEVSRPPEVRVESREVERSRPEVRSIEKISRDEPKMRVSERSNENRGREVQIERREVKEEPRKIEREPIVIRESRKTESREETQREAPRLELQRETRKPEVAREIEKTERVEQPKRLELKREDVKQVEREAAKPEVIERGRSEERKVTVESNRNRDSEAPKKLEIKQREAREPDNRPTVEANARETKRTVPERVEKKVERTDEPKRLEIKHQDAKPEPRAVVKQDEREIKRPEVLKRSEADDRPKGLEIERRGDAERKDSEIARGDENGPKRIEIKPRDDSAERKEPTIVDRDKINTDRPDRPPQVAESDRKSDSETGRLRIGERGDDGRPSRELVTRDRTETRRGKDEVVDRIEQPRTNENETTIISTPDAKVTLDRGSRQRELINKGVRSFTERDRSLRDRLQEAEKVYAEPREKAGEVYVSSRNDVTDRLYKRYDEDRDQFLSLADQKERIGDKLLVSKDLFDRRGHDDDWWRRDRDRDRDRDWDRDWDRYDRDRGRDHDWDRHHHDDDDDFNFFISIDLGFNHVHGANCGHYYYDDYWYDYPQTHVHHVSCGHYFHGSHWYTFPTHHRHRAGCGHFYDHGRWLSYGGYHHRHYHGCGHYYWSGIWHDYPIYHVHNAYCGHYLYDDAWHLFPRTHVHSINCGHYYDGVIWHTYGSRHHRHGDGCGHYYYRDRWFAYPETYYRYRPSSDFFFFINLGDYSYRRVPQTIIEERVHYVAAEPERVTVIEEQPVTIFEDTDPLNRAYADFAREDFFASIVHFTDAIDRNPDEGLTYLARAQSYMAIGDYKAAYDDVIAGMERIPDWPEIVLNLTEIYSNPETFADHLKSLEGWAAEHPQDYRAHFVLGYTYFFIQDYDRAKIELVYTLAYSEIHPQALLLLDEIYERQAEAETTGTQTADANAAVRL